MNQLSRYLKCTSFGFAVPDGHVIDGITMRVSHRRSPTAVADNHVFLVRSDDATIGSTGADRAKSSCTVNEWGAAFNTASYGNNTDGWGGMWAACAATSQVCPDGRFNVNHSNFGVAISAKECPPGSPTAQVDYVEMEIAHSAPTCSDMLKNQNESDLNCGGVCPQCDDGKFCNGHNDCRSLRCGTDGRCAAPRCGDTVKNGSETDIDCGGGCPDKCKDYRTCADNVDCESGVCGFTSGPGGNPKFQALRLICYPPNCIDEVKNGAETGVDCGGGCPGCKPGQPCSNANDCESKVCGGGGCPPNVCNLARCDDGVRNGNESDVDCGGSCAPCPFGKLCGSNNDCGSKACKGGVCGCTASQFTFDAFGHSDINRSYWKGGLETKGQGGGCEVRVQKPLGMMVCTCLSPGPVCDGARPWSVLSWGGYSSCYGTGGEDGDGCEAVNCPTNLDDGFCCSGYPTCPLRLGPGQAQAKYHVQCDP
jgi:hypothetical protein